MNCRVVHSVVVALLVATAAPVAWAQQVPPPPVNRNRRPPPSREPRRHGAVVQNLDVLARDARSYIVAPFHWNHTDWTRAGLFGAGLAGLFAVDKNINHWFVRNNSPSKDRFAHDTQWLGETGALAFSGALWVYGSASGSEWSRTTGAEALESSLISGVMTNVFLKRIVGRARPRDTGGTTRFEMFSGNASFPGGHATEAFAVASVIGARSDNWVAPTIAYTVATLVGFDRMQLNAHFASDIWAGAALGLTTGKFLVHRHEREMNGTTVAGGFHPSYAVYPVRGGLCAVMKFDLRPR